MADRISFNIVQQIAWNPDGQFCFLLIVLLPYIAYQYCTAVNRVIHYGICPITVRG
jgi:hypothetical protein